MNALDVLDFAFAHIHATAETDAGSALADDVLAARDAVATLVETQRETLLMLESAYRDLGMQAGDNKRIQRARDALARVGGAA